MADALTVGMQAVSTVASSVGHVMQGRSQGAAYEADAAMMEAQAKAEIARGSREAAEEDRQRKLMLSRAVAVAGASGSDRAANLEGRIEQEGQYRALSALWEGENAAQGLRHGAAVRRYDAKAAKRAGYMGAFGSFLTGASSIGSSKAFKGLLEKYGGADAPMKAYSTGVKIRG